MCDQRRHSPPPKSVDWTGALIGCSNSEEVASAISWCKGVETLVTPAFALGLVAPATACFKHLATSTLIVDPLLTPEEFQQGSNQKAAFARIVSRAHEGIIFRRICHCCRQLRASDYNILMSLITTSIRGGTLHTVARNLGVSRSYVSRHMKDMGCTPGQSKRAIRWGAYQMRVDGGTPPGTARTLGGWRDRKAWEKFRSRISRNPPPCTWLAPLLLEGP